MTEITSSNNPKIKQIVRLRDRRERDKTGLFLIEGYRELMRAVNAGQTICQLFTCRPLFLGSNEEALIEKIQGEKYNCNEKIFQKISYRDRPDGLIAVAKKEPLNLSDLPSTETPLYIIAEAIEKPGNLGTILRSADAAGATGVIVLDRCTDIYNPNVVRASTGTLFTIPVVEATSDQLEKWLKEKSITTVAATPSAQIEYTAVDLKKSVAIFVGTEQHGLSERWMRSAKVQVKIPMLGVSDSLNVATATTLLLFEAVRQRRS